MRICPRAVPLAPHSSANELVVHKERGTARVRAWLRARMLLALPDGKHGGEEKRELQLCFLTGKKAWWERVCPGSAAAWLWSGEGQDRAETRTEPWGVWGRPRVWGWEHLL